MGRAVTDLAERYGGRRPSPAGAAVPGRVWWLGVVGLLIGTVVFWAFFALNPAGTIETQTAAFQVDGPYSATIDARISAQPGTALACAIEAQNERSTSVGYKVVEVAASDEAHQRIVVDLRTTQQASLVRVRECWVSGN